MLRRVAILCVVFVVAATAVDVSASHRMRTFGDGDGSGGADARPVAEIAAAMASSLGSGTDGAPPAPPANAPTNAAATAAAPPPADNDTPATSRSVAAIARSLDADGAAEHVAHEAALAALRVSLQNAGARRAQQSTRATTSASLRAIKRALTDDLKALRGERVHGHSTAIPAWAGSGFRLPQHHAYTKPGHVELPPNGETQERLDLAAAARATDTGTAAHTTTMLDHIMRLKQEALSARLAERDELDAAQRLARVDEQLFNPQSATNAHARSRAYMDNRLKELQSHFVDDTQVHQKQQQPQGSLLELGAAVDADEQRTLIDESRDQYRRVKQLEHEQAVSALRTEQGKEIGELNAIAAEANAALEQSRATEKVKQTQARESFTAKQASMRAAYEARAEALDRHRQMSERVGDLYGAAQAAHAELAERHREAVAEKAALEQEAHEEQAMISEEKAHEASIKAHAAERYANVHAHHAASISKARRFATAADPLKELYDEQTAAMRARATRDRADFDTTMHRLRDQAAQLKAPHAAAMSRQQQLLARATQALAHERAIGEAAQTTKQRVETAAARESGKLSAIEARAKSIEAEAHQLLSGLEEARAHHA